MSYREHTWSILRTISHWTKARLEKLGATVTDNEIIATEDQLWRAGPSVRHSLVKASAVTISSGAPDWVPADAVIYIDLVNDRAWTEADGEVAINTLLGADANLVSWWNTSG